MHLFVWFIIFQHQLPKKEEKVYAFKVFSKRMGVRGKNTQIIFLYHQICAFPCDNLVSRNIKRWMSPRVCVSLSVGVFYIDMRVMGEPRMLFAWIFSESIILNLLFGGIKRAKSEVELERENEKKSCLCVHMYVARVSNSYFTRQYAILRVLKFVHANPPTIFTWIVLSFFQFFYHRQSFSSFYPNNIQRYRDFCFTVSLFVSPTRDIVRVKEIESESIWLSNRTQHFFLSKTQNNPKAIEHRRIKVAFNRTKYFFSFLLNLFESKLLSNSKCTIKQPMVKYDYLNVKRLISVLDEKGLVHNARKLKSSMRLLFFFFWLNAFHLMCVHFFVRLVIANVH